MTVATSVPRLEAARFTTNCRGRAEPIGAGEPALWRPRGAALTCASWARAEARPRKGAWRRAEAA